MGEVSQSAWTKFYTQSGRYEYQFQGRSPAVREGRYLDAHDYLFLVMDEAGWLYRIPVQLSAEAERLGATSRTAGATDGAMRIAERQLRVGMGSYRPRANAAYPEMDAHFAVDAARAMQILAELD